MSTKYGDRCDSRLIADDVALTDHAIARFRQRTPHDCPVGIHEAWRRGEWLKHPQVCQSDGEPEPPERVRIFVFGEDCREWGVTFLVAENELPVPPNPTEYVVATVLDINGFDHGPTRSYLHSHGPHWGQS